MLISLTACNSTRESKSTTPSAATNPPNTTLGSEHPAPTLPAVNPPSSDPLPTIPQPTTPPTNPSNQESESGDSTDRFNFQSILSQYSGRWYLEGYSDVYVDIYETEEQWLGIKAHNFVFSASKGNVVYPSSNDDLIGRFSGLAISPPIENEIRANKITLAVSAIYFGKHKFVPMSSEAPSTESPATEPPATEPPATEPPATQDVLVISNTQTVSNRTIDSDVYITSTGVVTLNNVTVNGNIYCYGQLKCNGCTANNVYAYAYGSMMSCGAFDGVHGKVSGGISCNKLTILDSALDFAFNKWGKR